MKIEMKHARGLLFAAMMTQGRDFTYCNGGLACKYTPIDSFEAHGDDDNRTKTGCLIGVALDLAGFTFHHSEKARIIILWENHQEKLSREVANYFQLAQDLQDKGKTWGEAFDVAEEWADTMS